jgi:hypothetical protein
LLKTTTLTLGHFLKHGPNLLERLFDGYNFLQLINEPTRITENSQTLIDLILVLKQRDKALQTFKKSPTNNSWLNYKVLRNRVVKSVRLAKQEYIQMLCDSNESHKLHKFLKPLNIYNSNSPSVLPHDIKDVEELRSHFINSVQCQTSTCDRKIEEYKNSHSANATNFEFSMCTEQEIDDTNLLKVK